MWMGRSNARNTLVAAAMPEPNRSALVGAFQRRYYVLSLLNRDIVGSAIHIAGSITVVGVADIGRRHVYRGDDAHGNGLVDA